MPARSLFSPSSPPSLLLTAVASLVVGLAASSAEAQSTSTAFGAVCANENTDCSFTGNGTVYFGAGTRWIAKAFANGADCNNGVFGDPAPGVVKQCRVLLSAAAGNVCASEGGRCNFSGAGTVYFGAGNRWAVLPFTNGADCNNTVFGGDPYPNVAKQCAVYQAPPPTPVAATSASYLTTNAYLTENQYVQSPKKRFYLWLGNDGNLTVYGGPVGAPTSRGWTSNTVGAAGQYFAAVQGDGNLCIYKGRPSSNQGFVWCSTTGGGSGNFFLSMQDDSKLVLFNGANPTAAGVSPRWTAPGAVPTAEILATYPPTSAGNAQSYYNTSNYAAEANYPGGQNCNSYTYTVPANVYLVKITATGGTGVGGSNANALATMSAMAGIAGFNVPSGGSVGNLSGGEGGRGATVSGFFTVTPGQTLYITPGSNGILGAYKGANNWNRLGFPGGGNGYHAGGGLSMVTTEAASRSDYRTCSAPADKILLLAGAGGGGGSAGTSGAGGAGGDAGPIGGNGNNASGGSGGLAGGGGGGGTQTGGGFVGSHPGCGTEDRRGGGSMQGGYTLGYGGPGGAGFFGGGAGGDGDCFLNTGHAGGGGGSSYAHPTASLTTSAVDTTAKPGVTIQPYTW